MEKQKQCKRKISFSITQEEYNKFEVFAKSEDRRVSNAARIIIMRFLKKI